jgi:hypothetical protein
MNIAQMYNEMYLIEPVVISGAVSSHAQNELEKRFIGDDSADWKFTYESTQMGGKIDTHSVLYNMLYYYKYVNEPNHLYELCKPVMWDIIEKANLPFTEFLQVRAVVQFPIVSKRTHNFIHTDLDLKKEYLTGVYYINDENVDGDTVIFNEDDRQLPKDQVSLQYGNFTEKMRVTPVRGSATIFNGHQYHASTLPTKSVRAILNFSWR